MANERARLAVVLQRIAPDLVASLWRVHELRDLPLEIREEIGNVLGCDAAACGI